MLSTIALFALAVVLAASLPAVYRALVLWERSLSVGDAPVPASPVRMPDTPDALPTAHDIEAERRRYRDFWAQRGVSVPETAPTGINGPEIERPLVQQIR